MNWQSPELVAASLVGLPTPRRLDEMADIPDYEAIAATESQLKGAHDDDRR